MIFFLTDWQSDMAHFEENAMFNVSKILNKNGLETQIVNTQLAPFLNYFGNQFGYYNPSMITNLLDCVLQVSGVAYTPVNLSDLALPADIEKTYTKTNVLLSKNGVMKGEVYFNDFGYVSEVRYFSKLGEEIHYYSERGYVWCKHLLDKSAKTVKRQIFDELGQLVFTEYSNCVIIAGTYLKFFKQEIYVTYKALCIELLNKVFEKFDPISDRIIADGSSALTSSLLSGFPHYGSVVWLFSNDVQQDVAQISENQVLFTKSKKLITDNAQLSKRLERNVDFKHLLDSVSYMPFYPTTLSLGESNSFANQYVYWEIEKLDEKTQFIFLSFLKLKLALKDLCLIVDSKVKTDELVMVQIVEDFVSQNFAINLSSTEYKLVKQYYEALEKEEMTPILRELFQKAKKDNPAFDKNIKGYQFICDFEFRCDSSKSELKRDLQKVRVFVDQRENHHFFNHSLAVSAGIPILSKRLSPYLIDKKNGLLLRDNQQMFEGIERYLKSTDKWNQNLVESIEVIENCGADELMMKWQVELK